MQSFAFAEVGPTASIPSTQNESWPLWRAEWRFTNSLHAACRTFFSWFPFPSFSFPHADLYLRVLLDSLHVLFIPSLVRVRRPCRGLEKFFPPVLQRCYGCSFHAQEIVHTGHGMLGYNCFFLFFLLERKVPAKSKRSNLFNIQICTHLLILQCNHYQK